MRYIFKTLTAIFFSFSCFMSAVAHAQPKAVELSYEVSRNGSTFGKVEESYQQTGATYQIKSVTKGEGIYALLGERVLISEGQLSEKGLIPTMFKLERGDNKRKSLSANFDWQTNQLTMLVKGEKRKAKLVEGAQDLASYVYQFMYAPPTGEQVKVSITTGKKFKHYTYLVKERNVTIKTASGKSYQTIHLVNAEVDGKKKKELWLAPEMHYLPVKYLVVEKDGERLEQVLTSIVIK